MCDKRVAHQRLELAPARFAGPSAPESNSLWRQVDQEFVIEATPGCGGAEITLRCDDAPTRADALLRRPFQSAPSPVQNQGRHA
jgi:hypothetical protein